jgi:aspartokinase
MPPAARLGGFKILKDVVWVTIVQPGAFQDFPASLCRMLADKKINLNFFTCGMEDGAWGVNLVVLPSHADEIFKYAGNKFTNIHISAVNGAVLSLFPHKSDPGIASSLFEVFEESRLSEFALANSYSAISALLDNKFAERVATGLFKPFNFSAFRTPSDWRLAQKGKEDLYKEVVASYQEKKPKVYVLQWQEGLELLHLRLERDKKGAIRSLFTRLNKLGIPLSFLITSPSNDLTQTSLLLCLPEEKNKVYASILDNLPGEILSARHSPVSYFSMNGPHFGDRYGIACELLEAFSGAGIDPIGLSCSVASISGIVSSNQLRQCLEVIQDCFEVPSLMRIGNTP